MISVGKERDGFYLLQPPPQVHAVAHLPTFDLWHWHLGHPSVLRFQILSQSKSFNFNKCSYHICLLAKQSRLPFSSNSISTSCPFEFIHCDDI